MMRLMKLENKNGIVVFKIYLVIYFLDEEYHSSLWGTQT